MRKTAGMLINEANFERKEEWDICNIIDDIKLKDAFERSGKKGKDEKAGRRIESGQKSPCWYELTLGGAFFAAEKSQNGNYCPCASNSRKDKTLIL